MLIDPLTMIAQIINFLILVVLLRHFLYRPITQAMEQREKKIASRFQQAEEREKSAQEEIQIYQQKQQVWEAQKKQRLQAVEQEAKTYRQSLFQQAQMAIETQQKQWTEQLQKEQEAFLIECRQQVSQQLIKITKKVLKDLASAILEEQIILKFQQELQHLNLDITPASPLVISSTFPISASVRSQISDILQRYCSQKITLIFEQSSQGICGIELRTSSQKITWNIAQYLEELEAEMEQTLANRDGKSI